MDTYNPQQLPFFPKPYPGESLYSILCRYHIRSGNATAAKTIRQLFGGNASLRSTLLLPSIQILDCLETWTDEYPRIKQLDFIWKHTAFSLFLLHENSFYRFLIFGRESLPSESQRTVGAIFRQSRLQHSSQKLRFCPVCAAEQKKIYGEAYWQIIPQLDGVEYCPFHHVRILSSPIHVKDLLHSFFPADTIVSSLPGEAAVPIAPIPYPDIQCSYDLFISTAKCIQYMWEHMPEYHMPERSGIWSLLHRYCVLLSFSNEKTIWLSTQNLKERLLAQNHPKLVNWLLSQIDIVEQRYIFLNNFSLAQHAMLISMLSKSPEEFFS